MTWIQIIDNDPWASEAIAIFIMDVVPEARIEVSSSPVVIDGYDIYIVDNEFDDGDHGIELVRKIRRRNPHATIVLCTATDDRIDVRAAMYFGCSALIEKGSQAGRTQLAEIIRRHLETSSRAPSNSRFRSAIHDIKCILSAWNARMDQESGEFRPKEITHYRGAVVSGASAPRSPRTTQG